jgi:hypothetical protein
MPDSDEVKEHVQLSARRAQRKAKSATKAAKRELDLGGFSPVLVGFLRGLLHAAIMGALSYISTAMAGGASGKAGVVGSVATIGVAVVRALEGLLDGKLLGAPRSPRMLGGARPK